MAKAKIDETAAQEIPASEAPKSVAVRIVPTVGRVVNFWPGAGDPLARLDIKQPLPAIVAYVHPDASYLNLAVFDANGVANSRTSVLLVQDGEPKPEGSFAAWMPYQTGQAAKTQALEAAAAPNNQPEA